MDILVVLEDSNGKIHRLALEAIVGAQKLAESQNLNVSVLAIGLNANNLASEAAQYEFDKVLKEAIATDALSIILLITISTASPLTFDLSVAISAICQAS